MPDNSETLIVEIEQMNLLEDYVQMKADKLRREGVSFDEKLLNEEHVSFLADCLEFEGRRILRRPRIVHYSAELDASLPGSHHEQAVNDLRSVAESGGDLSPYQTKRIGRFDQNDFLLSDWGIHHLHLGLLSHGGGFSGRTGDLLYAVFTATDAYFLGIGNHSSFSDVGLLEILDNNWPGYVDQFVSGVPIELEYVPTSADIKALRKAHVICPVQLHNGRVLFPIGGGLTTAGTSASCMRHAIHISHFLRRVNEYIVSNEEQIRSNLGIGPEIRIKLAAVQQTDRVCIFGDGNPNKILCIPVESAS